MRIEALRDRNAESQPRPEYALVHAEAQMDSPPEEIAASMVASPHWNFSEYSVPASIEAALRENRARLAALPRQDQADRLARIGREACRTCTPSIVTQEVARLIGSFPNASIASPEVYISALVFDILDMRIPDAVVVLTCQKLRRSSRFVPTISEVLEMADAATASWRSLEELAYQLPATRQALEDAVRRGEKVLAFVRREIAEGFRDAGGRILRNRAAYAKGAA